jgi:uncharacterized membrane protein YdjX (TVP38/TMEM64 family)
MNLKGLVLSKKLLLVLLIAAGALALRAWGITEVLNFETLKANREHLHQVVQAHYGRSVLLYIAFYVLVTGLSLPGATVLTLAGGFLFGPLIGALFVNVGATAGATVAFLAARYVLGSWIQRRYEERLRRFNQEIEDNGYRYLLTLRLIALFPFYWINILAGLTRVPLRTFIWTTSVGIFPGSLVYAFAGSRLNVIESPRDIFSLQILLAFGLLAVLPLLPLGVKKLRARRAKTLKEVR